MSEFVELSSSKLCNIQIQIGQNLNPKLVNNKTGENSLKLFELDSDTSYEVMCVTDEKVRLRNTLSLAWSSNEPSSINEDNSFDTQNNRLISNLTHNANDLAYLSGEVILRSNNLKYNNYVFCRFMTQNPSIYCEKIALIRVKSYPNHKLRIFLVFIAIFACLIALNALIYIFLMRNEFKWSAIMDRLKFKSKNTSHLNNNQELTVSDIRRQSSFINDQKQEGEEQEEEKKVHEQMHQQQFSTTEFNSIQVILESGTDKLI